MLETAQVALGYGADDLDGTVRQELIHHDAGASSPELLTVDQLSALIREADREPVERDTLLPDGSTRRGRLDGNRVGLRVEWLLVAVKKLLPDSSGPHYVASLAFWLWKPEFIS